MQMSGAGEWPSIFLRPTKTNLQWDTQTLYYTYLRKNFGLETSAEHGHFQVAYGGQEEDKQLGS